MGCKITFNGLFPEQSLLYLSIYLVDHFPSKKCVRDNHLALFPSSTNPSSPDFRKVDPSSPRQQGPQAYHILDIYMEKVSQDTKTLFTLPSAILEPWNECTGGLFIKWFHKLFGMLERFSLSCSYLKMEFIPGVNPKMKRLPPQSCQLKSVYKKRGQGWKGFTVFCAA